MSLGFINKNLVNALLVSEVILMLLFCVGLLIGCFFNIYYILIFSFFILVLGGLELALNILLLLL